MVFRKLGKMFKGSDAGSPPQGASLRCRTDDYWAWFAAEEAALRQQLEAQTIDAQAFADRLEAAVPGMAWEFCPSHEEGKEGLALSGEGDPVMRLLTQYMVRRAPELQHWTLYPAKQAQADIQGAMVQLGEDEELAFADFRFGLDFDTDSGKLEIEVFHPRFAGLPEQVCQQLGFLALDGALGEDLIECWVGPIDILGDAAESQRWQIDELRRQAHAALSLHDLEADMDPLEQWSVYESNEIGDGDLQARADVHTGTIRHPGILRDLGDPEYDDPLRGTGACLAYVMFPSACLTSGKEVEQRSGVEDQLRRVLAKAGLGELVGGAFGQQYTYIDLFLCDEAPALVVIREVLRNSGFITQASLRYFSSERQAESQQLCPV